MIPELRRQYNDNFTNEAYQAMLDWMGGQYNHYPKFHVAETPVFYPEELRNRIFEACDHIIEVITAPDFAERSAPAIPPGESVPGQNDRPLFLQFDFGICEDELGNLTPQLVEAQGFPSLYFYQFLADRAYRKYFPIPPEYQARFGNRSEEEYMDLLRRAIIGDHPAENVVLLEIEPAGQTTRIDFIVAQAELGIKEICISEVELDGDKLYYQLNGQRTRIHRIFNRVIFDELKSKPHLKRTFNMIEQVDVEWAGHPNWFFLLSKYTLPFINSPYVPTTNFVSDLERYPEDLENYVLKPLYSFAGMGVDLHPTRESLDAIETPEHFILQRKVKYADVVATPDGPARVECRMMFVWPEDEARPILVNNLARLSKGEMIGVRYNQGKSWVGGSIGYFPPLLMALLLSLFTFACNARTDYDTVDNPYGVAAVENGGLNVIVEIPAGTNHKIEYHEPDGFQNDTLDGDQRIINFLPYPGNYGFVPSTLMDAARGGDGDPLDVLVISESVPTGTKLTVKPIGALLLRDRGEIDTKIIAVPQDSSLRVFNVADFTDFSLTQDAAKNIIEQWFLNYKGPRKTELLRWEDEGYAWREVEKWKL